MKCTECGKEMERGYVGVVVGSILFWLDEEPKHSGTYWMRGTKGVMELMKNSGLFPKKKDWLHIAYRCSGCKIVAFGYGEEKEEPT